MEAIMIALIGAVAGAGGLGGLWAWMRARDDNQTQMLTGYYDDLSSRVSHLETLVQQQAMTIAEQQSTISALRAERDELRNDMRALHAENDALRAEVRELQSRSEAHDDA